MILRGTASTQPHPKPHPACKRRECSELHTWAWMLQKPYALVLVCCGNSTNYIPASMHALVSFCSGNTDVFLASVGALEPVCAGNTSVILLAGTDALLIACPGNENVITMLASVEPQWPRTLRIPGSLALQP